MKIVTKFAGQTQEFDISPGVKAIVRDPGIKIEAPEAEVTISPKDTAKCMAEMSQRAWEHISTGPMFAHFWGLATKNEEAPLPQTIKEVQEDWDDGMIHLAGLIILLVEAQFDRKKSIFIKDPETGLHPRLCTRLMSLILEIGRLSGGKGALSI